MPSDPETSTPEPNSHMNIVFVGHVDHGKSTIVGRLLADTNTLPKGKLEALQADLARQGKPFEYAYLIDALKDERKQNITIDTARIFFKSAKRDYLILDAPGHIEFIKNMVTGASHAEAAVLVIDAHEGVMENSRRHGQLLGLLGIRKVIVAINKMDLVGYDQHVFEAVKAEYAAFLDQIGIKPDHWIPLSGRDGSGVAKRDAAMPWYCGPTLLEALDSFEKGGSLADQPFRMPVQDVYKFGAFGDQRRIIAGSISSGQVAVGDALVAFPSGKQTHLKEVVEFNAADRALAQAGEAVGLTMAEQIYLKRGEILCRQDEPAPQVSSRMRASLFWIGRDPLVKGKPYLLKLGTARESAQVEQIHRVLDADSYGEGSLQDQVGFHEVAEVTLKLAHPIAFDTSELLPETSRFVLVDGFEIAGGGIVLEALEDERQKLRQEVFQRERKWVRGQLTSVERAERFDQEPTLVILTGKAESGRKRLAAALETGLFEQGKWVYYLGIGSVLYGVNADLVNDRQKNWPEHLRRFGEVCNLLLDTGMILIITAVELREEDVNVLRAIVGDVQVRTIWLGAEVSTDLTPDISLHPAADLASQLQSLISSLL